MTKINFKAITPAVVSLVMGATLMAPAAFADNNASSTPAYTPLLVTQHAPKPMNCSVYSDKASRAVQNLANRQIKIDNGRTNLLSKLNFNRANTDKRLADNRLNADQKRADVFARLQGKNLTDAQKAAIATFQAAVAQAVTDRRTAIDAAITAYRTALDQAIASRQGNVNTATTTYAAAVQAAYAKAYSDCQASVSRKTINTNLNAALKAARKTFVADRQTYTNFWSTISPLAKTRQQAIAAAEATFKTALNAAKTALKAAFPPKVKTTK
jgi:hypothetical protein